MSLFWGMVFIFCYCVGAKMLHFILEFSRVTAKMFQWNSLSAEEEKVWPVLSVVMALLWPLFGFWLVVMEERDEQKKEEGQA